MKYLRLILLTTCMIAVLTVAAEQNDPVISSIQAAYQQAKESTKKNKGLGNDSMLVPIMRA